MKRSKLLFLTPCIALTAITPSLVSCGNGDVLAIEDIQKALFEPNKESIDRPEGCTTFIDCLNHISDKDRKIELIYSMYAPLFYVPGLPPFGEGNTILDLWNNNTFALSANISKCSLEVTNGKVYASFIGYVNLVFLKAHALFVKNDFLQFTLFLDNKEVTPKESKWCLDFKDFETDIPGCWGFVQAHLQGSTDLYYLRYLGWEDETIGDNSPNWHNWKSN